MEHQKRKVHYLHLTVFLIFSVIQLSHQTCKIKDPIKFRSFDLASYPTELLYFQSPRIHVSLCTPIPPDIIKANCITNKPLDNINFMHVIEKDYKRCVLKPLSSSYLKFYDKTNNKIIILITQSDFKYTNGLKDNRFYKLNLFSETTTDFNSIIYNPYQDNDAKYEHITLSLPSGTKGKIGVTPYVLSSVEVNIGIMTIFQFVVFLSQSYALFMFHLNSEFLGVKYPIQITLAAYLLYYFGLLIVGIFKIEKLMVSTAVIGFVWFLGMFGYFKCSLGVRKKLPVILNFIVFYEYLVAFGEQYNSGFDWLWRSVLFFGLFMLVAKGMTMIKWFNHLRRSHWMECAVTVTVGCRITMCVLVGLNPMRNPIVGLGLVNMVSVMSGSKYLAKSVIFVVYTLFVVTFRMKTALGMRRMENKMIFENQYFGGKKLSQDGIRTEEGSDGMML